MGVWKLGTAVKDVIETNAKKYADQMVYLALNQCPLTRDMLERGLNTPEAMEAAARVIGMGYNIGSKYSHGFFLFNKDNVPAVARSAAFLFNFDNEIMSPKHLTTYWCVDDRKAKFNEAHSLASNQCVLPNTDFMHPDDVATLAKWINQVVRAERTSIMVVNTVNKVLETCLTTADLAARWPSLATLVEGPAAHEKLGKHMARYINYLRNPPRDLRNYAPTTSFVETYGARMQACEAVIQQGLMLTIEPKFYPRDGLSNVKLIAWTPRPADPPFANFVHKSQR